MLKFFFFFNRHFISLLSRGRNTLPSACSGLDLLILGKSPHARKIANSNKQVDWPYPYQKSNSSLHCTNICHPVWQGFWIGVWGILAFSWWLYCSLVSVQSEQKSLKPLSGHRIYNTRPIRTVLSQDGDV